MRLKTMVNTALTLPHRVANLAAHDVRRERVDDNPPVQKSGAAQTGQIIVMFALFSTALIGVLGLATDLGIAFAGRRAVQNAADAGAYAGARVVAKAATTTGLASQTEVGTLVSDNGFVFSPGLVVESCQYVNDSEQSVGNCSTTVPSTATGVKVTVSESHSTFFIRVLPGAPATTTTRATATAHIRKLANIPSDGPFLPCGINTKLANGSRLSIVVKVGGIWQINPAAVNQTFEIHGPQIEKCSAKSSRFKGVADQSANRNRSAPPEQWFNYTEGDTAGPVSADVQGLQGCKAGQAINNCVAFLPIVIDNPPESGNNRQLWTIGYAPFYIVESKSNEHTGKLLGSYIVKGPVSAGWTPQYLGPIVVKLTS